MLETIRRNVSRIIPMSNGAVVRRQESMEKPIMVDSKSLVPVTKRHALRRGVILSSVAGLAIAAVVAAPLASKTGIPTLVSKAAAAETTHTPDSFADLAARVKPAVISVRVKMANDGSRDLSQISSRSRRERRLIGSSGNSTFRKCRAARRPLPVRAPASSSLRMAMR